MQAGDFVRWTKQVIDLLGQVADAALRADDPEAQETGRTARAAADLLRRGVVAYSSTVERSYDSGLSAVNCSGEDIAAVLAWIPGM